MILLASIPGAATLFAVKNFVDRSQATASESPRTYVGRTREGLSIMVRCPADHHLGMVLDTFDVHAGKFGIDQYGPTFLESGAYQVSPPAFGTCREHAPRLVQHGCFMQSGKTCEGGVLVMEPVECSSEEEKPLKGQRI